MSLARLVFPELAWAELSHILSFLTLRELWLLGCCNKSAFVTFMRETSLRIHPNHNSMTSRFLNKYSRHDKIGLVSYPRSGNSFLRKLLEEKTGIITGSDNRPNRPLASDLLRFGYRGEGITDSSVWVVKSHYPERMGYIRVPVQCLIIVVRNPFDSICSYFHMAMTNTHNKALTPEVFQSLRHIWTPFVCHEAQIWTRFHRYWLSAFHNIDIAMFSDADNKRAPAVSTINSTPPKLLLVRYEDLIDTQKRDEELERILAFMRKLSYPHCSSLECRSSRDDTSSNPSMDQSSAEIGAGYAPKKIAVGKALAVMTMAEIESVRVECAEMMELLGYRLEMPPLSRSDNDSNIATIRSNNNNDDDDDSSSSSSMEVSGGSVRAVLNVVPMAVGVPSSTTQSLSQSPSLSVQASSSSVQVSVQATAATVYASPTNSSLESAQDVALVLNNDAAECIRNGDDPYGRNITQLRRSLTDGDTKPLATLDR